MKTSSTRAARAAATFAATAAALAVVPAVGTAATLSFDRECVPEGVKITATVTGFKPNANVLLTNSGGFSQVYETIPTDAAGNGSLSFFPPSVGSDLPMTRAETLTATDPTDPALTAPGGFKTVTPAFSISGREQPGAKKRTWKVSGLERGKVIYAHYLFKGRYRGSYKLGTAVGPCGELTTTAPAVALKFKAKKTKGKKKPKVKVPTGDWAIQLDHSAKYSQGSLPRLRGSIFVTG